VAQRHARHEGTLAISTTIHRRVSRDISFIGDFNHPKDNTLVGDQRKRPDERIQVQQLGIGGDSLRVRARAVRRSSACTRP